jgi:hypothetical protein
VTKALRDKYGDKYTFGLVCVTGRTPAPAPADP